MKPSETLTTRLWLSLPAVLRAFLWEHLQVGPPPWRAQECVTRLKRGDVSAAVYTYLCRSGHRNYLVEIAIRKQLACLLFIEEVSDVLDALESARDVVYAHSRGELED